MTIMITGATGMVGEGVLSIFVPACSRKDIAEAMIATVSKGYSQNILEVKDIKALA